MSQKIYIQDILERFEMSDANLVSTLLDPNVKLIPESENNLKEENLPYRVLIGRCMSQHALNPTYPLL